jgi:hypothetical protein
MNTQVGAIVVSMLFAVGTAGASYAADTTSPMHGSDPLKVMEGTNTAPQGGMPPPVVTGQLLKIDGNIYVVKDRWGKEIHFQLDERTRMNARPKVGDQIMAKVEPQGYAYSINKAN